MIGSKNKSILFITPAFFGYEESIKEALVIAGYDVDYYDERISNNSIIKAIFRVKKSLLNYLSDKYYRGISEKIKAKKYDFFFLIKGEVVPEHFILQFKKSNPEAKLIYYTYDSFNNNNKHSKYILKHFDKCYSFDFDDVKANQLIKLKHLFYTNEFTQPINKSIQRKYSISFVGTLHSNRYITIKTLFEKFENTLVFFYSPAKWFFFIEKVIKSHYKKIKWQDVSFNKLNKQQVADIFKSSKSVLDIQRFGQTGLTMRTFEVLASGAVLVTTNATIRETDFYDPNYIVVIDDLNDVRHVEEIKVKTGSLGDSILSKNPVFEKYFVNNWVKEFFE